ncbi:MAG: PDZ domain-containing protein [Planctomycetota bacterium]
MNRLTSVSLLACLVGCGASSAIAQADAPTPEPVNEAAVESASEPEAAPEPPAPAEPAPLSPTLRSIADLDAEAWATRQRATETLLDDPAATPRVLADAINAPDVSAEADYRLRLVLHHKLVAEMLAAFPEPPGGNAALDGRWRVIVAAAEAEARPGAGSLGIMHQVSAKDTAPEGAGVEVRVLDTLPGFPAYAQFRAGDAIVGFAGQPVPDDPNNAKLATSFSELIQSHDAGEAVTVRVLRDQQEIDLRVTLAGFAALRALYTNSTTLTEPVQEALNARLDALLDD